jgi:hypothetical protein
MPLLAIVIIVLTAWGVGAAAGSASTYLIGAVAGVTAALILLALFGAIAAWRSPDRGQDRHLRSLEQA